MMKVENINSTVYGNFRNNVHLKEENPDSTIPNAVTNPSSAANNNVSFKGIEDVGKRFWLNFRKLSNYMKKPSEMTNAAIAAIGTGAIAPIAIESSPMKKGISPEERKTEREKKHFQALRQPVSAVLAFGFQVPTTIGIAAMFNKGAYKKHWDLFKDNEMSKLLPEDKEIGTLITDKEYLAKQAKKALKRNPSEAIKQEWAEELAMVSNWENLKQDLINELRKDYEGVGIDITEKELAELAEKPKTRKKFLAEKMAKKKHDKLLDEKVKKLRDRNIKIEDLDIVTEDFENLAKERFKTQFNQLEKDANLSAFDRFLKSMGFSNKKLKALDDAKKKLAKDKGLEIMQKDRSLQKVFETGSDERLRKFVENLDRKSQKIYQNKLFWFSLATNLVMVAISCVALNWIHPKFAAAVEEIKGRKQARQNQDEKKVEVRA